MDAKNIAAMDAKNNRNLMESTAAEIESRYYCSQCIFTTASLSEMQVHEKYHGVIFSFGQFPAIVTKKRKTSADTKDVKENMISEKKRYSCSDCDYRTDFIVYLKQHRCRILTCSQCSYETRLKQEFQNHSCGRSSSSILTTKDNQETKKFECSLCTFSCNSKGILRLHSSIHAQNSFKCTACDFITSFENVLDIHILREHSNKEIKNMKCLPNRQSLPTRLKPNESLELENSVIFQKKLVIRPESKVSTGKAKKPNRSMKSSKLYSCSLCNYTVNSKVCYGKHLLAYHEEALLATIKNVLRNDQSEEFLRTLTPQEAVAMVKDIPFAKPARKSPISFTPWTLDDKKELYWCHIYSRSKIFDTEGCTLRRRHMLEARNIMDKEKMNVTPDSRFHSMIANIRIGKTRISAEDKKQIEKDVEDFIKVKLMFERLNAKTSK